MLSTSTAIISYDEKRSMAKSDAISLLKMGTFHKRLFDRRQITVCRPQTAQRPSGTIAISSSDDISTIALSAPLIRYMSDRAAGSDGIHL